MKYFILFWNYFWYEKKKQMGKIVEKVTDKKQFVERWIFFVFFFSHTENEEKREVHTHKKEKKWQKGIW